jgi:hypothetical protein
VRDHFVDLQVKFLSLELQALFAIFGTVVVAFSLASILASNLASDLASLLAFHHHPSYLLPFSTY